MPVSAAASDADIRPAATPPEIVAGVYVHWPFCESKCPYCDFNSHVRDAVDHARWRAALIAELEHFHGLMPEVRIGSVFFGGGTPSLMPVETAAEVIAAIRRLWPSTDDCEITLEANPSSAEAANFRVLAEAGVNRLSLGVQSFDDAALSFLGRRHDAAEARRAIDAALNAVENVSIDLIYARPGQTLADWEEELNEALTLGLGHLSLYQLTIEPNTGLFAAARRGAFRMPEDATAALLYEATQETTAAAGLPAYEISNHARPDLESRHNLAYWRGQPYLGVGPGAHGRLLAADQWWAAAQTAKPEGWLAAVETAGHGTASLTPLAPRERAEEAVMMGLRLVDGIPSAAVDALDDVIDAAPHAELVAEGLLIDDNDRLAATARGRLLLNEVLARLLV